MTTYTTHIPAGWYPDPLGLPQLRWWDNHTWTDQISEARAPLVTQLVDTKFADPVELDLDDPVAPVAASIPTAEKTTPEPTLASTLRQLEAPLAEHAVDAAEADGHEAGFRRRATANSTGTEFSPSEWTAVAAAINAASRSSRATVLAITSPSFPMLIIDVQERSYWWKAEISAFPESPAEITIRQHLRDDVIMPTGAGFELAPLLWMIGHSAYANTRASWLSDSARFRLRRWPNITSLPHDADQLRMTSILSHAPLSATELAAIAGTAPAAAHSLLAALSLMNILRTLPGARDEEFATPTEAPRGLFARLRGRHSRR